MRHRPLLVASLVSFGMLAASPAHAACVPDAETLCLHDGRYQLTLAWSRVGGVTGTGKAVPLTDRTGAFWFFNDKSYEVMVKIVDGTPVNGRVWVFLGSLTNVEFTLLVNDTVRNRLEPYYNPPGNVYGLIDLNAFEPSGAGTVCGGIAGVGCDEGLFCEFEEGACCCDMQGLCLPIPEACPEIFDPVCGCDGMTYGNDCIRQMAGVGLDHRGECLRR